MSGKNEGEADNVAGLPTVFQFDQSPVRAVMYDSDPWFIAKDVCEILDLEDPSMTVSRLDEDQRGKANVGTTSGPREMLTVSESGLYSLIFTSRKPEAKRFRKWVTSEVLPEIRKTGGYRRPGTEFAGLSGERVEYERWLLERALLDAKLIALGMQAIGVHYERMATDDPDFGAARADTNYADYERELRENVYRSREFMRRAQPGSVFNRGSEPAAPSSEPSSKSPYPN
jgi:prophage antirepressor-like protein